MKPPRLVLLRPRNADNLGAIARAMKNFGLTDWVVVSPNPKLLDVPGMNRLAVKAGELLESVRLVESMEEAVASVRQAAVRHTRGSSPSDMPAAGYARRGR